MFDVFYFGNKPKLFPYEQSAANLMEAAHKSRTKFFWFIDGQNDYTNFNFSFKAMPWEENQIHTWPNQWQSDGGVYFANKNTIQQKIHNFHTETYIHRLPNLDYWQYNNCNPDSIDKRWAPDPLDLPYIYQFPVRWGRQNVDGPCYCMPDATEVKYLYDFVAEFDIQLDRWSIPEEINKKDIDLTWRPDPSHPPYIYHFGSQYQISSGLIYTVPGAIDIKFLDMIPTVEDVNAIAVLDIFFIDKYNNTATSKFIDLQEQYPHIQKVRYANSNFDTIYRCITRSKTNKFWVISSENNYLNFDFGWHADPWQGHMTHVFASQHQKWSDTFLINKHEFIRHAKWATNLEQFPNLNFVNDQTVCVPSDLYDIYLVDHGNEYPKLTNTKDIKVTRHVDNYLDTFKRIMSTATTEYVWIISSLCDYKKFDFSWHPEPWQKEMIHVFPSGNEARGDTFYIHVESFKQQMVELDLLDWFNVINYCKDQMVMRLPIPTQMYEGDNLLNVIKQHEFKHPYTWFFTQNYHLTVEPCLWGAKDKKIYSYSDGNSYVLVPREAKTAIKTQGYDYPYISKSSSYVDERELDIIYISNGEPDEERWYDHLVKTSGMHVKWVHNIDGRAEAYKAAATRSKTPWFFTVFAKLEVEPDFDWLWQPDYLQEPKHYVFHSHNPVNGLEYGHMGVIAYNKRLVLETDDWGLDFTLSKEHAVVPILSATAYYNTTPELTWRTAFREVLKLKDDVVKTGSIESNHRLKIWLTKAEGNNAEWSLLGATDAIEYYTDVNGNYQKLLLSFEWKWLQEYYATKYNMI